MKTALQIPLLLALAGLAACARPSVPPTTAPRSPKPGTTALEVLRLRAPATQWDPQSQLKADLDQDGAADYALSGLRGKMFVVGIVQGPAGPSSRHWTLEFPEDAGLQEGLCSLDAKIELEAIEEEGTPARPAVGINLHDDRCDSFHIFWDPEQKTYDWWRL